MKKPGVDTAAIVALLAGSVSAVNSLLTACGNSLGYVSIRESGMDVLINHIAISGSMLLLCGIAFALSTLRGRLMYFMATVAVLFVTGFAGVK